MKWVRDRTYRNERSWFWVRESFHFFGGAAIGMVGNFFKPWWVTFSLFGVMFVVLLTKEVMEDEETQTRFKTVVDLLAWVLGFWVVSFGKFS